MADALGLAGYFAPVPSHNKFLYTPAGGGMAKYGPAGWTAQGGVTAALLAEMGYQGDRSVLDGEYGFWAMNGSEGCDWAKITGGLGEQWNILQVKYKCWPSCGVFQSPLGAFTQLVNENDLKPEEIQEVLIENEEHGCLPRFQYAEIRNSVDTQTNLPYNIALAAHRIKVSAAWQKQSNIDNPSVREFMGRVKIEPYSRAEEARHQEMTVEGRPFLNRRPSRVQLVARGKTFTQEVEYAKWLSADNPDFRATDEDLAEKFRANGADTLSDKKLRMAIERIMNLEAVSNTAELMEVLSP
jgi:2-methylcitrate dehydratase PrpD